MPNYLVVATSGRAIAQGLKLLGNSVTVVDGFADSDTCAAANNCIKVKRSVYGLDADEVQQTVRTLQSKEIFDGLFYDAALESNSNLLDDIDIQPVFGNSRQTLKACKNAKEFFTALDRLAIPYPQISFHPESISNKSDDWLIKDAQGTGGAGVTPARIAFDEAKDFTASEYLQQIIDGINFSITFLAACSVERSEIMQLGFNTQWSEPLSDSVPFAYGGAVNQVKLSDEVKETASQYAQVIAKEFKLLGLNSIDFICAANKVYVLEVNPRIPASYELYETKYGELMKEHIEACESNVLPKTRRQHLLRAHAIVYAPKDLRVSEDILWPLWSADRPHAGELIKQSEPVCNVFAGGQNSSQVYEMIEKRKQTIIAKLVN